MNFSKRAGRMVALLGLVCSLGGGLSLRAAPDKDVAAGWAAFDDGDAAKALADWERAAKRGVAEAYAGLGMIHLQGNAVPFDPVEARRLFELGAEAKEPDSMISLARMLNGGEGGEPDEDRARALLEEVAATWREKNPQKAEEAESTLLSMQAEAEHALRMNDAQTAIQAEEDWKFELARDETPGGPEYWEGYQAFDNQDFGKAFQAWKRAAALGNRRAFAGLGLLYGGGWGVAQDKQEARRLHALGATKGDPAAMLYLAHAWAEASGGPADPAQAKYWYEKVAAEDSARPDHRDSAEEALATLADKVAAKAPLTLPEPKLFAAAMPKPVAPVAADPSSVSSADMSWAVQYEERKKTGYRGTAAEEQRYAAVVQALRAPAQPAGKPGQADYEAALKQFEAGKAKEGMQLLASAAKANHVEAMLAIVDILFASQNDVEGLAQGIAWLKVAAATGDPKAVARLREFEGATKGLKEVQEGYTAYEAKNYAAAATAWKKAAELGSGEGAALLADLYTRGVGVEKQPEEARRLLVLAAERGDADGMMALAEAWRDGLGGPRDLAKAKELLEQLRAKFPQHEGILKATATALADLKGETRDSAMALGVSAYNAGAYDEAMQRFRKATELGGAGAAFNLGVLYEQGRGVPRDPLEALTWYEKSKAMGFTKAADAVTRLQPKLAGWKEYKQADELQKAKKYREARALFEKAAGAGSVEAMSELGEIYERGIAVIRSDELALKWYQQAADKGDTFASIHIDSIKSGMDMRKMAISQNELADMINGVSRPKQTARPGPAVAPDSLIKNTPWTGDAIMAAIKSGADAEALAVAIQTDGAEDFYDGDYRRILALGAGTPVAEWGNLNRALIDHKKTGAGKWARDLADAAIAARRAQLKLPPPAADSAELRAKAVAGDFPSIYALVMMGEKQRTLGPLPENLPQGYPALAELALKAKYTPAYWLAGDGFEYNVDKTKVNIATAVAYYRQAAEAGDAYGADKLANAYYAPGEPGVAPNFFEAEHWLIEAAARARPDQFSVMAPEVRLALLYGGINPVGFGTAMREDEEDLRWLRELQRRGGAAGEMAQITLDAMRREERSQLDAKLKAVAPEVAPWPASEVTRLENAAKAGDVAAMLKLADALATGRGVRQHDARALEYYRQAAARGSAPAMKRVAYFYAKGYAVKKDEAQRLDWLRKAAATGGPDEALQLALELGRQGKNEYAAEIVALYEKAIAGGLTEAAGRLATQYKYGFSGIEKSDEKALAILLQEETKGVTQHRDAIAELYAARKDSANAILWWRKAWEAGDQAVALELGKALMDAGQRAEGMKFYQIAADQGIAEAQFMYASYLGSDGRAAEAYAYRKKLRETSYWEYVERLVREYEEELDAAPGSEFALRKQAKAGDTDAMVQYAQRIAAKDREDAVGWLRLASEKGNVQAKLILANEIAAKDKPGALKLIREAADSGNTQAMVILAQQLYATDKVEAIQWIEKAEAAGNLDAKFQLGGMYFQGRDVPVDQAKGLAMMNAAADGGSLAAMFEMGRAHVMGMPGLLPNPARGLELLKKAAAAKVPQAAAVLGEIYERGVGVTADPREALKYYKQAVALGLTQIKPAADRLETQLLKGVKK